MSAGKDKSYCIINIENDEGEFKDVECVLEDKSVNVFNPEVLSDNKNLHDNSTKFYNDQLISTFKESSNVHFNYLILALSHFRQFINTTKLLWIVAIYTVVGANLFMWLEVPYDLKVKAKAREYHLVARDSLLFKVQQIHQTRGILERNQHWKRAIIEFEQAVDCGLPEFEVSQWTFWMSILYCCTIYTTVGYGNIACSTIAGRIATILYAICGIPMMIVVLDQLSTFLLKHMKKTSNFIDDFIFYLGVRFRFIHIDTQESFFRYIAICRILSRLRLISSTITFTISEQQSEKHQSFSSSSTSSLLSTPSKLSVNKNETLNELSSKIQTRKFRSKSIKYAFGKGSVLNNLEPFQIESIVEPNCDLLVKKIFLLPTSREKSSSSKTPSSETEKTKTIVKLKLNSVKDSLLKESLTTSFQSRNSLNLSLGDAEQQQNYLTVSKETLVESVKSAPSSSGKLKHNPPLIIALFVTTGWIFFAAGIFCLWEEWDYFTSVYFFFISMSTIGFGDITPQHPQYMIMSFFVVVVGLSLVNVCISVVQEKVSQLYMEILNKMLQQYVKASASGDLEAMKGAMIGFNSRCKYLMPFLSKNQGIRLMNKFKEDVRAMGVDLPEVLTELNEENGRPTFCKIFDEKSEERVNQFLQKANQQGKMRRNAHTQTKQMPLQKTHKFFISRAEEIFDNKDIQEYKTLNFEVAVQTDIPVNDLAIQCSPLLHNNATELKLSSEILEKLFVDCCTNTFAIPLRNQGIQPEVSCIIHIFDDYEESSDELFKYPIEEEESAEFSSSGLSALNKHSLITSGSSRDDDLPARRLSVSSKRSQQMRRMEEIELDDFGLEAVPKPPPRVTIHMASTVFETISSDEGENKARLDLDLNKKLRKREIRNKTRKGLRFMRNVAIQTVSANSNQLASQIGCPLCGLDERFVSAQNEFVVLNKTTQYSKSFDDLYLLENGSQTEYQRYFLSSRNKRIQTDFQLLISRPSQTQLSSTFQKSKSSAHFNGKGDISALEAATHGSSFASIQKEILEIKKAFGLDDEEVNILREKLCEVKARKQKEKIKRSDRFEQRQTEGLGVTSSSSSDADGGCLTKEDKLALLSEIKILKASKNKKENKYEISCEDEEDESTEDECDIYKKKRNFSIYHNTKDFTQQISQSTIPLQLKNFGREKYEETILDIQLIRSPFFETKYLPQSEKELFFEEVVLSCRETSLFKNKRKIGDQELLEEEMLLLDKFERLNTILSTMKSDDAFFGRSKDGLGASTLISDFGNEPVCQFMYNSEVQTDAMFELIKDVNLRKWGSEINKMTQTDYLEQSIQYVEDKKKSLMEKVISLWRGKERQDSTKVIEKISEKTIKQPSSFSTLEEKEVVIEENIDSKEQKVTNKEEKDLISKSQTLIKKFKKAPYEEKGVKKSKLIILHSKKTLLEGVIGTSTSVSKGVITPSGPAGLPFDLSEIIFLTDQQTGEFEAMRRTPLYKDYKSFNSYQSEQQLIPLSSSEWAQLIRLFPELLNEKGMGRQNAQQHSKSTLDLQKCFRERIGMERNINESKSKNIKMIPLKTFIASNKNEMTTKSYNKFTEDLSHVDLKYISWLSSSVGPSTNVNLKGERLELEYYRRWLENWLGAGGNLSTLSVLYDIPLRDISEFLHVKREVISQLERQKHQMDRMADLAGKRDKTARMVDLSIQTGVLSRVVQSLGEELTEISDIEPINIDTMEVDYLTNPAFSIARVTLETTTDRGDEEKEFN